MYVQASAPAEVEEALLEVEVRVAEPGGEDADEHLLPCGDGVLQLPLDEIGSELLEQVRLHRPSFPASSVSARATETATIRLR